MNRTRTGKNVKRLIVWLLMLTMVFSLLPMAAFADEAVEEPVQEPVEEPAEQPDESATVEPEAPAEEPAEEPADEPEEPSEPSDEPEEPADVIVIDGDELQEDEIDTLAADDTNYNYSIVMVDCGRKYYSVENINSIIDSAANAGMHYVMLAVGNEGLRFLLNDMSLTFNGESYSHEAVSKAIHAGNRAYDDRMSYNPKVDELTESDMNKIMQHANDKGVQIIPLINTPGHMDAILYAMGSGTDALKAVSNPAAFSTSNTTIDISNADAVAFTQALLQKYITYFANKGCTLFNMGADEYANDVKKTPHFNDLITSGGYSNYISHVNTVAGMIESARMRPMAFNDGIYYNNNSAADSLRKSILVCYWSPGWGDYNLASASSLRSKGFELINTNGSYYWVVGKADAQCNVDKANGFDKTVFPTWDGANWGTETIADPSGAMFCVWSDYPAAMEDTTVVGNVTDVISAFGGKLPATDTPTAHTNLDSGSTGGGTTEPGTDPGTDPAITKTINLKVGGTATETVDGSYDKVTTDNPSIAKVVPDVSDKPGTGTTAYELTDMGNGGTFYVSNNATATKPTTKLTIEIENGNYYIKDGDGNYKYMVYWSKNNVELWDGKEEVSVATNGTGCYTISRENYLGTGYLTVKNGELAATSDSISKIYLYKETKTDLEKQTTLTFTGVAPGTTYCTFGETKYEIVVDYKQENISAYVGGTTTVSASGELNTDELDTGIATVSLSGGVLSVTGVAEGTTNVTVGGTKYTITVTNEDLRTVTPLTLEFWITNGRIADKEEIGKNSAAINASDVINEIRVASSDGVDITAFVPKPGYKDGRECEYWRCRLLDETTGKQTGDSGVDKTTSGVGFTKVRYYNSKWQVYTENFEWVDVTSDNQLVAYYLEHIKVSDEVESYAADWGNRGDGTLGGWLDANNYVTLSMQVVYEDGSRNPLTTTASDLKSKTIVYGQWENGRGIGTVILDGTEYEIYKVTSETGAVKASISTTDSKAYAATVTQFTWNNNEKTVWEGEPTSNVVVHNQSTGYSTDGVNENLYWKDKVNAILLRVYVRAKATPDSLTVHYYDQDTNKEFYYYNITVKQNVTFDKTFARTEDGKLTGNKVTNINDQTQTVQYALDKMKEVGAQYKYAEYNFVDAKRSEDGKDVYLYYTFKRAKTFVVDFGIPLVITASSINESLGKANITGIDVAANTKFAKLTADVDTSTHKADVIYELQKTLDGSDTFYIRYSGNIDLAEGTREDEVTYSVGIIPATSVYYEDGFAKFENGKNTASGAKWELAGNEASANQALSELGSKDIYGYDSAYDNSTEFSMGSAHKVTVTSGMLTEWNKDSAWPTASFTFKGTGFDIISLTDGDSGAIIAEVKNNKGVNKYIVNNYYGYTLDENGKWVVKENSTDCLYQIPVMKITGLEYDEYTVTIQVFYDKAFDMTGNSSYSFWLDAIRVYDPMGTNIADYSKDKEGYPQYIKLRDQIAASESNVGIETTLFIDGNAEAEVAAYTNYGPNNEVYLANGQAISFKLPVNDKIDKVQIGAKTPNATDTKKANSTLTGEIATATEMYYDITEAAQTGKAVTITNIGDAILSLTNIKITYKEPGNTTELEHLTDSDAEAAVATVRALFAAPVDPEPTEPEQPEEPEKTFEPEHFETSWSSNVRKGGRAVLTVKASTDVDAIIVDGVTYTKYFTRTERVGRGWNAQRVTYREFVYMMTVNESGTLTVPVVAVSNEQGESNPYETTLTVKPSSPIRDWIGGLFGRWF